MTTVFITVANAVSHFSNKQEKTNLSQKKQLIGIFSAARNPLINRNKILAYRNMVAMVIIPVTTRHLRTSYTVIFLPSFLFHCSVRDLDWGQAENPVWM